MPIVTIPIVLFCIFVINLNLPYVMMLGQQCDNRQTNITSTSNRNRIFLFHNTFALFIRLNRNNIYNQCGYHPKTWILSTASYLSNKSPRNLYIIPRFFKSSICKTHKINTLNVHFYLSIIQLHQLFHLGGTHQTLNTLLTSIIPFG